MCLSNVDNVTKRRRIGYKLYYPVSRKIVKGSIINRKRYPINKLIKDRQKGDILASDGTKYKTGFHYYFRLIDAELSKSRSPKAQIYRILARKITCSGKDFGVNVGVAREIFIKEKVEYLIKHPTEKLKYRKLKSLLKVKEIGSFVDKIYKKASKKNVTKEELHILYKNFMLLLTRDLSTFCEYVSFVDKFEKYSELFTRISIFHLFSLENYPEYLNYYHKVCHNTEWIPVEHFDNINWKVGPLNNILYL